jgi:hypothetical protein
MDTAGSERPIAARANTGVWSSFPAVRLPNRGQKHAHPEVGMSRALGIVPSERSRGTLPCRIAWHLD